MYLLFFESISDTIPDVPDSLEGEEDFYLHHTRGGQHSAISDPVTALRNPVNVLVPWHYTHTVHLTCAQTHPHLESLELVLRRVLRC